MIRLPTKKIVARSALSALLVGVLLALCSAPALAETFTVKNTKNGGPGSQRRAIQKATAPTGTPASPVAPTRRRWGRR